MPAPSDPVSLQLWPTDPPNRTTAPAARVDLLPIQLAFAGV